MLGGTNAEDRKVSGNTARKPTELADSGVVAIRPTSANTHENAYPNSSSRPKPATTSSTEALNEKPMITP